MPDNITLHTANQNQVTCVSNTFIEELMPDADGEYVKIYLYLLHALSDSAAAFSIHAMADRLGHTERDIRKCLIYWQEKHLLRLEYDEEGALCGICLLDPDRDQVSHLEVHVTREEPANEASPAGDEEGPVSFSPEQRTEWGQDPSTRELMYVTEQFFGRPLSQHESDQVLFWHYTLGLPVSLVEYLVEVSLNSGHPSIHYMNAIALSWKKKGIRTEEEARRSDAVHSRTYHCIARSFGISGRQLTPREEAFLDRWSKELAFSDEMIQAACERTIRNTGKPSFDYADRILSSWASAGARSPADVESLDRAHAKAAKASSDQTAGRAKKNSFHDFEERTLADAEYAALEKRLLND